jgi:MFS family permease
VPIAAAALWILLTKTPSPQRPRIAVALDWRGGLLGAMFLGLLNYALIEAAARGFQDPRVFGCLAGAAAALVLFVRVESRASRPMLPPALFRVRTFSAACLLTLAFYSSLYGLLFFLSLNLIQVQEYDAALAGLAQLPVMLLVAILAPWSGRLVDRRGPRLPLAVGASLASLGFLLLARVGLTAGPTDYWQSFFPPLVLLGAAMGFVLVPLSAMIMSSAHGERAGVSSAMNAALSRLSSVLGIAILGPIVLVAFEQSLKDRTSVLPLGAEQRRVLLFQASRLAEAQPPRDLPPLEYRAAKNAIKAAFVTAFQLVSLVCAAAVALTAALVLIMTRKLHNPAHDASGRN